MVFGKVDVWAGGEPFMGLRACSLLGPSLASYGLAYVSKATDGCKGPCSAQGPPRQEIHSPLNGRTMGGRAAKAIMGRPLVDGFHGSLVYCSFFSKGPQGPTAGPQGPWVVLGLGL